MRKEDVADGARVRALVDLTEQIPIGAEGFINSVLGNVFLVRFFVEGKPIEIPFDEEFSIAKLDLVQHPRDEKFQKVLPGYAIMYDQEDPMPMFVNDSERPPGFDGLMVPCYMVIGSKTLDMMMGRINAAEDKLDTILRSAEKSAGKVINDSEIKRIIDQS